MNRTSISLLSLVLALIFSIHANAITWNFYDFGDKVFDEHNNTSDIGAPGYPGLYPYQPSPGEAGLGGERYDIEGLNFAQVNDKFYVSLTSSFKYGAYSSVWNYTYRQGDLFFGFNDNDDEFTLVTRDEQTRLYAVSAAASIPIAPGGFGYHAGIRNSAGPWRLNAGTDLGQVQSAYMFYVGLESDPLIPDNPTQTNGDTWVKEYCFDARALGSNFDIFSKQKVNFRTTMECGNDLLRKSYSIAPEPGTMILLGVGIVGIGIHLRKRR